MFDLENELENVAGWRIRPFFTAKDIPNTDITQYPISQREREERRDDILALIAVRSSSIDTVMRQILKETDRFGDEVKKRFPDVGIFISRCFQKHEDDTGNPEERPKGPQTGFLFHFFVAFHEWRRGLNRLVVGYSGFLTKAFPEKRISAACLEKKRSGILNFLTSSN